MIKLTDLSNRLDDLESSIGFETWEQQTSDGTTQTFKSNDGLKTFVDWMYVLAERKKDGHAMTCNDVYGVRVNGS